MKHKLESRLPAAAAAAKSLQSCPTLSDPMDCSLPGSSIHGIFQARVLEWGATAFSTRLPGEISITSDLQMTPLLMAESEEELKSLLMSRDEGLRLLHGLATNLATSLQTPQEA